MIGLAALAPGASYTLHLGDCFEWMDAQPPGSIHAIVTDPPSGLEVEPAPPSARSSET